MASKMWALVKWIGGEDDKKYTTGVPIEWIKGFDIKEFRSDNFDPTLSYVIEWHGKSKKPPPGGWPVYDGFVIDVSNRIGILEKKMQSLDGLKSPNKTIRPAADEQQAIDDTESNNSITVREIEDTTHANRGSSGLPEENINKNIPPKVRKSNVQNDQIASGSGTSKTLNKTGFPSQTDNRQKQQFRDADESEDEVSSDTDAVMSGVVPIDKKKARAQLYKADRKRGDNGGLECVLEGIRGELKRLRKNARSMNGDTSDSSEDEMKEIGPHGSGVFVTEEQWHIAKTARTYTAMGISLLVSLFPMDVLLRSNLRGGKSKIQKGDRIRRPPLDKKLINVLYYTVRRHFKTTFNKAGLGMAINNKLTHLRTVQKKNQPETPDSE